MKTHLEITDLPSDTLGALGKLRTVLVATYNKAREHKHRMTLLKSVLKFAYNKCAEFEKHQEALEEAEALAKADLIERTMILQSAKDLEIDLDERSSTENLAKALEEAIAAKGAK